MPLFMVICHYHCTSREALFSPPVNDLLSAYWCKPPPNIDATRAAGSQTQVLIPSRLVWMNAHLHPLPHPLSTMPIIEDYCIYSDRASICKAISFSDPPSQPLTVVPVNEDPYTSKKKPHLNFAIPHTPPQYIRGFPLHIVGRTWGSKTFNEVIPDPRKCPVYALDMN